MGTFFRGFACFFYPVFAMIAVHIWRPPYRGKQVRGIADRVAWTGFALGVCLMLNMVLHASLSEGDGDFRTWETITLHRRLFFAFGLLAVLGPLAVFLMQLSSSRRPVPAQEKDLWKDIE